MDFPKVGGMPFSVYGNAMIPPVAPITDGTGAQYLMGLDAADFREVRYMHLGHLLVEHLQLLILTDSIFPT